MPVSVAVVIAYPIGSPVLVGADIPGVVTAVMVERGQRLSYRVAWWDGRNRQSEWVGDDEVAAPGQKRAPVLQFGFGASAPASATAFTPHTPHTETS